MAARKDLISPFLDATRTVLQTMAATEAVAGKRVTDTIPLKAVTGTIDMVADKMTGNLIISFDEKSILAISSRMLMENFCAINQEVIDVVGELTNMICGGAKSGLEAQGVIFSMASPQVFLGAAGSVDLTVKSHCTSVQFSTPEGNFIVEANLGRKK